MYSPMPENENPELEESKGGKEGKEGKDGKGNTTDQPNVTVTIEVHWPTRP
jgi:hypothetical protein